MTTRPGRRLVLLRHGRTAWNESGRAQGHADVELDEVGRAQAEAAAAYLATLRPVALWTSDLTRARQTAGYLERATGLCAKADERLREYDVGSRQGMTMAEFAENCPGDHEAWLRGEEFVRAPGAETVDEVHARLVPALQECLDALAAGETGVVVSHGASLKVGLLGLLGWPQRQSTALSALDNCAWATVSELEAGRRLRLDGYNQQVSQAPGTAADA